MEIGKKLKDARMKSGFTQEMVAEKINVSRQTISNWENEKSYPDIISVIELSSLYSISLVPDQEPVVFVEKQKEKAKAIPGVMQPVLNHRHVPCVSRQKVRRWDTILIAGPR